MKHEAPPSSGATTGDSPWQGEQGPTASIVEIALRPGGETADVRYVHSVPIGNAATEAAILQLAANEAGREHVVYAVAFNSAEAIAEPLRAYDERGDDLGPLDSDRPANVEITPSRTEGERRLLRIPLVNATAFVETFNQQAEEGGRDERAKLLE